MKHRLPFLCLLTLAIALLFTACNPPASTQVDPNLPLVGQWEVDANRTLSSMPESQLQTAQQKADFLAVGIQFKAIGDKLIFATLYKGVAQREALVEVESQNGAEYVVSIKQDIKIDSFDENSAEGAKVTFTLLDANHLKMQTPAGAMYYQRVSN